LKNKARVSAGFFNYTKLNEMSREATETKIAENGLRYKTKVSGSPFGQQKVVIQQ